MTQSITYKRKRLGEILLERGWITEADLEKALKVQQTDKRVLGVILMDMGLMRHCINDALAQQRREIPSIEAAAVADFSNEAALAIPETLARRFNCIGINNEREGVLVVAMENPNDLAALDILAHVTNWQIEPVRAPGEAIVSAIEACYGKELTTAADDDDDEEQTLEEISLEAERGDGPAEEEEANASNLAASAQETPVVKFVEALFRDAANKRASDVHLDPEEKRTHVRLRVDGQLQRLVTISRRMYPAVVSRIKILSGLNIAERRLPQDGRCRFRLGGRREVDVRVSTLPAVYGEKIVMRLLDKSNFILDLEHLGFSPFDLERFKEALTASYGMLLLSGPTGSGKTTTLYAALGLLNEPTRSIVTVEDPVEYEMAGLGQVSVRSDIGLTFAACLRSILRQDPNVIMIGEMRDLETTEIAIRAALTGHLVLSTLHANNAPAILVRLIEMGIPPYLVSATLNLGVAQRLVRRLCEKCKQEEERTPEVLAALEGSEGPPDPVIYRAVGCEACDYTGYRGRMSVYEVMPATPRLTKLILENRSEEELRSCAREEGMKTLHEQCVRKVQEGTTTLEEVLSVPDDSAELEERKEPLAGEREG